ncbi:uncharacterized protein LOC127132471 isoform X2 [Lathyrus oleraceus]|uniref:uncharacterized protein LOC127132471 isoform X2 n=1 Tax=Pisum sativum TaxID=3888 RepID=UPI0021D343AD|nr:uncharacterized protein LOC127132471 isoform X2 [Pisum sativum]
MRILGPKAQFLTQGKLGSTYEHPTSVFTFKNKESVYATTQGTLTVGARLGTICERSRDSMRNSTALVRYALVYFSTRIVVPLMVKKMWFGSMRFTWLMTNDGELYVLDDEDRRRFFFNFFPPFRTLHPGTVNLCWSLL